MREQLITTFDELMRGVEELQKHAERGEMQPIVEGLPECLAAIAELRAAVLSLIPSENGSA
jgi:hypothetical protein